MDLIFLSKISLAFYLVVSLLAIFYLIAIRSNIDRCEQIINEKTIVGGFLKLLSLSFLLFVLFLGFEKIICFVAFQSMITGENTSLFSTRFFIAFALSFFSIIFIVKIYHESYLFRRHKFISMKKFEVRKIQTVEGIKREIERMQTSCPDLVSNQGGNIPFSKLTFFHILQEELRYRNTSEMAKRRF